jgi:hypothetical protein
MADWQPYREPLRTTLTRTLTIAIVAGVIVAFVSGRVRLWPALVVIMLWPSFGGHWIDLLFLNWVRPRLPASRPIQLTARLAVWFAGGIVLALGARVTAMLLLSRPPVAWLTWAVAGAAFIAVELIAHAVLQFRGRPSFYNGLG